MPHDISNIMIGPQSNQKDGLEVKEAPKLPSLLPKLMEGRRITSQSLFLALPPEILAEIMALIAGDKHSLSALALVNSDCGHLARSYQFVDVCFDYGPRSGKLIERLLAETQARADATTATTTLRFIGSYIRRVKVQPATLHVVAAQKDLHVLPWQSRDELRNKAVDDYLLKFRRPILKVLSQAMPHLDSLLWYDEMCLDVEVFKTLAYLPLRLLEISGAYVGGPLYLEPPVVPQTLSLQSLSLGIAPCTEAIHTSRSNSKEHTRLSSFMSSFLRCCCESLESLTFQPSSWKPEQFQGHETMVFPRLLYLDLASGTSYPDAIAWSSFLAAPLRHLSLPQNGINTSRRYMSDCPILRDLETLVVPSLSTDTEMAESVVDFVLQHSHVRKLSVQNGAPEFLDRRILPAIVSGKWSNLTSLSISWRGSKATTPLGTNKDDTHIAAESLAAINCIKSLEQLCLSACKASRWHRYWLPIHNDLRLRLQGLENLQKLAFSEDTYEIPDETPFGSMERYYEDRWVTQAVYNAALARPQLDPVEGGRLRLKIHGTHQADIGDFFGNYISDEDGEDSGSDAANHCIPSSVAWERAHRNHMLCEAERYAAVFPKLHWVFCGQLPMSVKAKGGADEINFEATPLSQQRDPFSKILTPIFEMKGDDRLNIF